MIVRIGIAALACATAWANPPSAPSARSALPYQERWVYASNNLLVDENIPKLEALIGRAAAAGFNGVMLADYKFNILDRMPDRYFKNVERVRQVAARSQIEIIPAVFPIGYSDGLLAHDPNLAEGLPVIDAPFVVTQAEARPVEDSQARLANGDLELTRGDIFSGFGFQDDPGKASVVDRAVVHGGSASCRMRDTNTTSSGGNCRLIQKVKVRPHACYRFMAWVKTQDLSAPGNFRLMALAASAGGRPLSFYEGGIEPTQDWKRVEVVFNSLDQREVNLYAGLWGGVKGTLWIDDLRLDELSLVNVLRRGGCPLAVRSADGKTTYTEGRDFEKVADDKLGMVPYAGEFEFDHDPARIRLARNSRIKNGQKLRVSWYHPVITHGFQVMCCPSEPKVYQIMRDQAKRVNDLFHPKTIFMSHDEIRVANWCQACQDRKLTPGAILADNARKSVAILREINPQARIAVWSDMFDPNHNAVANYYLVNGSLAGSWEGLPREVIIANWNSGKAEQSLRFFADRGHRQIIAGYYDVGDLSSFQTWDAAARNVPGISGFMYTTWQANYGQLEAYGKAVRGGK